MKTNLSLMANALKVSIAKHSPEILTGIGIAGMITTTILAVKATPKAIALIESKKYDEKTEELPKLETVKTVWKCYIPAVATGCLSVVCLIGANSVNLRRNAALAAAYSLSESTLKEYQQKVIETVGERKEQAVRDAIAKDKITDNPPASNQIIFTDKGNTLCYDACSDRYFKSDIDKLKKAENELNRRMRDEMYISLNEFYMEIGINPIEIGNDLGWNIDQGYIEMDFSSQLTDDGIPCLVISYRVAPKYDFGRY